MYHTLLLLFYVILSVLSVDAVVVQSLRYSVKGDAASNGHEPNIDDDVTTQKQQVKAMKETVKVVAKANAYKEFQKDLKDLRHDLLPGAHMTHSGDGLGSIFLILVAVVWGFCYCNFFYRNDLGSYYEDFTKSTKKPSAEKPMADKLFVAAGSMEHGTKEPEQVGFGIEKTMADIVIVFHMPDPEVCHDMDREVSKSLLENVTQHIREIEQSREKLLDTFWEECLKMLGCQAECISEEGVLQIMDILGHNEEECRATFAKECEEKGWNPSDGVDKPKLIELFNGGRFSADDVAIHAANVALQSFNPNLRSFSRVQSAHVRRRSTTYNQQLHSKGEFSNLKRLRKAEKTTLGEARIALLQDLYHWLPKQFFSVDIFASIDRDELFLCISLDDEAACRYHLAQQGVKLQLTYPVIRSLHVNQLRSDSESAPPFLRFDRLLVSKLFKAGGVIEKDDPSLVYRVAYGRNLEGSLMSSLERVRAVFRQISEKLDPDSAMHAGLIKDWYAVHSSRSLSELAETWSCRSLIADASFVQPLFSLERYFGSRVALEVEWNGVYCKLLLAFLPVSLILCLVTHFAQAHGRVLTLAPAVITFAWARVASNSWCRAETFLMALWNLKDTHAHKFATVRAKFHGTIEPSAFDRDHLELHYPVWKLRLRRFGSDCVSLIFCSIVLFAIFVWLQIFEGDLDFFASLCLTIMINVFIFIFDNLVEHLTEFENHKYQKDFFNSYLSKQFFFRAVTNYSAFFYLAVKQRFTEKGCPESLHALGEVDGCLTALQTQLSMTVAMLSAVKVMKCIGEVVKAEFRIRYENFRYRRNNPDKPVPELSFLERQAKYGQYRHKEQCNSTVSLVISLGFVLMFGSVAPIVVPLCLAVFWVELRVTAYLLVNYTRRPLPRIQFGTAHWANAVELLTIIGIFQAAFCFVIYTNMFRQTPIITRATGVFLFICLMGLVRMLTDLVFPAKANHDSVSTLLKRRDWVKAKLLKKIANVLLEPQDWKADKQPNKEDFTGKHLSEIENREWVKIPCELE